MQFLLCCVFRRGLGKVSIPGVQRIYRPLPVHGDQIDIRQLVQLNLQMHQLTIKYRQGPRVIDFQAGFLYS